MGIKLRQSPSGKALEGTVNGQVPVWNDTTKEWETGTVGPTGSAGAAYGASGITGSTGPNWKGLSDVMSGFLAGPLSNFTLDGPTGVLTYTGAATADFLASCSLSVGTAADIQVAISKNGELIGGTAAALAQGEMSTQGVEGAVTCQRLVSLATGDTIQPVFKNVDETVVDVSQSYFAVKG